MRDIHTRCLQDVSNRISKAYKNYSSRKKHGLKAGQPRFKKEKNYNSFTYNHDSAFGIEDERLRLGKLKDTVRIVNYEPVEGRLCTCTISRTNNKWYASITYETDDTFEGSEDLDHPRHLHTGIDLGINNLVMTSYGKAYGNPRQYEKLKDKISKIQSVIDTIITEEDHDNVDDVKKKDKLIRKRDRLYERYNNTKKGHLHKLSRELVDNNWTLSFEDLNIRRMLEKTESKKLHTSIYAASWGMLTRMTEYKAESADTRFVLVNPAYTSQRCSQCDNIVEKDLSIRIHECPYCGLTLDRDWNAAINIRRLGLQALANGEKG